MAGAAYVGLPEAVALLEVKPATLYTYVSRGWVGRVPAPRGRGSLYSRADLERLRARHDARAGHTAVAASALRWGEPVIDSAITTVIDGTLYYRGHDALGLAQRVHYEQVAELLFSGVLPHTVPSWPELEDRPAGNEIRAALRAGAGPVRSLLCAVALLRARSPRIAGEGETPELERGRALLCWLATGPGWAKTRSSGRRQAPRRDQRAGSSSPPPHGGIAARCARALGIAPGHDPQALRAIELALITAADHELNPSTFTARVVASAGSDLYSCIAAALGAMSGPRHGGGSLRVEALLDEALSVRRPADVVRERLARGARLPGFGHPLYPGGDPRARVLLARAAELDARSPRPAAMLAIERAAVSAGLPAANLDFGMVALCQALALPPGAALFLFSIGRLAGWIAHIREQRVQGDQLRPRARYTGPAPIGGLTTRT
jgi:citrate synthase